MMSKTLLIAEVQDKVLSPASLATLTAAKQLPGDVEVLLTGEGIANAAAYAQTLSGVTKVLVADHAVYRDGLAENLSQLICQHAKDYRYILAPATSFGKNLLPRVAALLDVDQISDITAVVSDNTFMRPIYAGNALATVQSDDPTIVVTVRPSAFSWVDEKQAAAPIQALTEVIPAAGVSFIDRQQSSSDRPELGSARVVVSGGRGLQNAENFQLLNELAEVLHAAIGASRAAVDAGFIANDYQVGQTGKVVAPDLYIAIGISGAIQHIAGIRGSKVIVAINKDPDAAIFQIADFGLVGDLFSLVPELTQALKAQKA